MLEGADRAGRDRSAARRSDRADVGGVRPAVGKSTLVAQPGALSSDPLPAAQVGSSGPESAADSTASHMTAPSATPSGSLPYRNDMERLFGRSLPDVEVHAGMAAELAPLGAEALTIGRSIAFAEAQPSPELVAHEATHVLQNERAGTTAAMASGVVAPRDSGAEAEADANARSVATHGMGVRLPPVAAVPAAQVHLAPKRLVPQGDVSQGGSPLLMPDANHPSRRDVDGEQVIQTNATAAPGKASPLRQTSWTAIAQVAESVHVQDDAGDTLHIDITYRLESRPAEIGEIPDLWVHTERKALLTIGSGEHAGATIVGQARIHLAPGASRDPKSAIAMPSIGPNHWAQVYLAEATQFVNLQGAGGQSSLLADAAGNDVLAYEDPLRTLIGLKNILKQQRVAGHGADVAKMHLRAQRLLVEAKRAHAVLEREISSIKGHHDLHPGRVAPVKFLVGDIAEWLAANHQAGRDDTEDARQLRKERVALEHLIADAERVRPPERDQLDDTLMAPVRFAERTTEGAKEVGAMAIDAVVLGVDAIGKATGIGTFDYHPLSKYGQAIETTGADTTTALVGMVNGFADEWSDAVERAKHGDYRGLTDVSLDTLMLIEGARTGGVVALDKLKAVASKIDRIAKTARSVAHSAYATGASVPVEVRNISAALANGADAFLDRLQRAGGMQMAAAGGGSSGGPKIGGLSAEALAEAAQAAKAAFNDTRQAQHAPKHGEKASANPDAGKESQGPTQPAEIAEGEAKSETRPTPEHTDASGENVGRSQSTERGDHQALERKPFRTREGAPVDAVEQGRAVVPTGKVEIYPRGKVKAFTREMAQELKWLKNERQTARKEFDKDPAKATRIKKLEDLKHNQDRSIEMARSLDGAGLPDTPEVNEEIIRHLLDVGQTINESNRVRFRSELARGTRKVKLLSTWVILPDGRALLSTLMVIPQ